MDLTGTFYYYFDDTNNKIRYFVLDVFESIFYNQPISAGEIRWFSEKLSEVNDYKIVVFSNAPVSQELGGTKYKNLSCIQEIEEAYNNCKKGNIKNSDNAVLCEYDYTDNTNVIIAHISGNTHRDKSSFKNNVLSISTTADYYTSNRGEGMWNRAKGTNTEQAFDIMTIDSKNNKLYATRVGAGKDRQWNLPVNANKQIDIANSKVSGVTPKYYTGKDITLDISVSNENKKLIKDVDYDITYSNNKNEGVATVKICGKGYYKGTITRRFRIIKDANIDTNKEYYITSAYINGRAIDGGKTTGANIVSSTLNCGDTQKFKLIKYSDGTYHIQNFKTKECIEICAGKTGTSKTALRLNSQVHNYSQRLFIGKNSNGTITMYTNNGLAIQVSSEKNNMGLIINNASSNNTQQFVLKSTSEVSAANIDTKNYYCIVSSINTKKAVDVYAGKTANLTNVDIYDLNKTDAQKFKFVKNSDGTYTILNKGSNKAIDVYANSIKNNTNVDIYTSNNTTAQKWYAIKNTDNTITFLGAESGKALNLFESNTTNFTNINILDWNQSNAQKWKLVK